MYTGREYDREINLYFLRARYYNPETGRFISRDPIGQRDQINLYTYVKNSPLVYMDRMGLNSKPFISSAWDVYMTWSDNNGEYLYNLTSVINQSDVVKDLERIRNYGGAVTVAAIPLLFFPATAPI